MASIPLSYITLSCQALLAHYARTCVRSNVQHCSLCRSRPKVKCRAQADPTDAARNGPTCVMACFRHRRPMQRAECGHRARSAARQPPTRGRPANLERLCNQRPNNNPPTKSWNPPPLLCSTCVARFAKDIAVRITMIGGGYVGLVSGACFAEFGTDVIVVEADAGKLAAVRVGRMPIYEPGLEKLVTENVAAGRLAFTGDLPTAVQHAEAVFIAVGTPTRRGDGHADLTYVYAAVEQVAKALTAPPVIVTKSTVPVGTGRRI